MLDNLFSLYGDLGMIIGLVVSVYVLLDSIVRYYKAVICKRNGQMLYVGRIWWDPTLDEYVTTPIDFAISIILRLSYIIALPILGILVWLPCVLICFIYLTWLKNSKLQEQADITKVRGEEVALILSERT